MIDIEKYISDLIALLKENYRSRLLYVGLQGSYLRGEATEISDMDIMVVIDDLGVAELEQNRKIIQSLPQYDKSCGFICSREDLASWNPLEIANLIHCTKDYYGILREYVPEYTEQDVRIFVKFSINNLYHSLCHGYIHADHKDNVSGLHFAYKSVFFILQNLYYLKSGMFIATKNDMLPVLKGSDYAVMKRALDMNAGVPFDFSDSFSLLFIWCQETLKSI